MTAALKIFITGLLLFGAGVIGGCAGGGDDACIPGDDCTCDAEPACSDKCDGNGCGYTCSNTQSCDFDCPDGGCNVSANNAGAVTLDCPGGGCVLACAGSTSCKITGCPECICSDDSTASGVCGL